MNILNLYISELVRVSVLVQEKDTRDCPIIQWDVVSAVKAQLVRVMRNVVMAIVVRLCFGES